jgi:hypothetical protein
MSKQDRGAFFIVKMEILNRDLLNDASCAAFAKGLGEGVT